VPVGRLADVDPLRVGAGRLQQGGIDQPVVDDDVGLG